MIVKKNNKNIHWNLWDTGENVLYDTNHPKLKVDCNKAGNGLYRVIELAIVHLVTIERGVELCIEFREGFSLNVYRDSKVLRSFY